MKKIIFIITCLSILSCCKKTEMGDLETIVYAPTPYTIPVPSGWFQPEIPADNPMTAEGVALGRRLFYDPILSVDSTISCSSCHQIQGAFTDNVAVSKGVQGRTGRRSAMSLVNMAFMNKGLFWDGRVRTLEEQALLPVEDHLEMAENWSIAEQKLQKHSKYPEFFRKAFGINNKSDITRALAAKAIAQFERSIVSQDSKYDKILQDSSTVFFTDDEQIGYEMFFNRTLSIPDAQCGHCHQSTLLTTNQYLNNGLQEAADYENFADKGYGEFTKNKFDNGKMRTPTLRNIAFSAPYMHNGSLKTMEDVMAHYISGGKFSPNKDPLIQQIKLNNIQKRQVLKFIETLNDSTFLKNPAYQNPFK